MALDYKLTQDQINQLQSFINGTQPEVFFTDLPEQLFRLAEAVRHQCMEEARKAVRTKNSLERRMARIQQSKEKEYCTGKFEEKNRDSLEVAYAIKHIANRNGYYIKRSMLISILFDVFANWIYSAKEILTDEMPKATEKGPQFWKVYNKIDMKMPVEKTKTYYDSLVAFNPGVVALIQNVLNKYALVDDERVAEIMMNNSAYRNATKEHNDGKWNKIINAADIYIWKRETKNQ